MLDLTIYKKRYYEVQTKENEYVNLEPPKRKQLKKILFLTKNISKENLSENDIDALYEAALIAFNKNKENKVFSQDDIDDILGLDALYAFFDGYYNWVYENVNQKN